MRVRLLGTGSADRWPNPWCSCPSCAWARTSGSVRQRTSVLINGHLLIDPGPDIGSDGVDLSGVRTVLITHAHPDHLDPSFLLAWTWGHARPLTVAGPPEAISACRPWVGPDARVEFRELSAGEELAAGPVQVRALPAAHATDGGHAHDGTAMLFEVVGDGALLYATDTAELPHANLRGPYDLVLLDETFGDRADHGTAHLDFAGFDREVGRLRTDGRLAPGGRVVAVHLSHHNPPDVDQRLAALGAEVLPDGSEVVIGGVRPEEGRPAARRLLITGGARSGKSSRAEAIAARRSAVTYVATAVHQPDDPEWAARVADHRARRPAHWQLRETLDVTSVLSSAEAGELVLVDCMALWVTGLIDREASWSEPARAAAVVEHEVDAVISALLSTSADVLFVTNEVGSGVVPATASGRLFRDLLGRANARIAAACDDVELVVAGIATSIKGRKWTPST